MTGYAFVPLPPSVARRVRPEARLDERVPGTLTGCVELELTCEQAVHVGSGFKRLRESERGQVVVRAGARVRGQLGIPGSSMKGVIRSRYEAITKSCVAGGLPRGPKDGQASRTYGTVQTTFTEGVRRLAAFERCDRGRMCPACALFGMMSQSSRVAVGDFAQQETDAAVLAPMVSQFGPRLHHLGSYQVARRTDDSAELVVDELYGRKFSVGTGPQAEGARAQLVEALPPSAGLAGRITVRNVTPAELGGLLAALGVEPVSRLKVGAGKGHGFGRVLARVVSVSVRQDRSCFSEVRSEWRQAFSTSEDRFENGEQTLAKIHDARC